MGLFSIFNRTNDSSSTPPADPADAVQQARTRARRRLIGAVVLLAIGVIGFPLVFETRPRPVPVDIPIEIPKKESVAPLVMPPARTAASGAAARTPGAEVAETSAAAPIASAAPAASTMAPGGAARVASRPVPAPALTATTAPPASLKPASAGAAKTETRTPAPNEAGRFVVQVGAFAEANSARDARTKAEKLGLKTYTQVAQTPAGSRIRVRIGPFASRSEADAALAKARAAGLSAVVLAL